MDSRYTIANTNDIISPGLVLYKDLIAANLRRMLEIAGGPERLRPHVKTHKMREVVLMQMDSRITKFKCATIAEAEMVASCGARDVLIAYQLVGPNQPRLVRLMQKFPGCEFGVLVDHPAAARSLSQVVAAAGLSVSAWLDVDVGQYRTGIPVGTDAASLYELIGQLPGLRAAGLHVYDGHNHQPTPAERAAAVRTQFSEVVRFKHDLERRGVCVPRMVCGGTPTFPIYAKLAAEHAEIECSPGTCLFNDNGYGSRFPEMGFQRAALILTRVISRTAPDRMCLDLGYKAVASDPKGDRLVLLDLPDAKLVLQNEEHLLVETPDASRFQPGDELLACPTHICPTCALHKEAYVVEGGRVTTRWQVAARDRWLDV
jgi:D-serine deaminase-like pyridoxal phosphate-dependent protein